MLRIDETDFEDISYIWVKFSVKRQTVAENCFENEVWESILFLVSLLAHLKVYRKFHLTTVFTHSFARLHYLHLAFLVLHTH